MRRKPIALVAIAAALTFGVLSAVSGEPDEIPTLAQIENDTAFNGDDVDEVYSFADDVAIVSVLDVVDAHEEQSVVDFSVAVLYSFKSLEYPDPVFVRQVGGVFESRELGRYRVETDQTELEPGKTYQIALRYEDGLGFFNVMVGPKSVSQVADVEGAKESSAGRSVEFDWHTLGIRRPLESIPRERTDLSIVDPSEPPADSRRPDAQERAWIESIERSCRESMPERRKIESILTNAVAGDQFTKGDIASALALVDNLIRDHERDSAPDAGLELRDGFRAAVEEVNSQLSIIRGTLENMGDAKGEELVAAIVAIDLAETSIELSWTRLGTDACARE